MKPGSVPDHLGEASLSQVFQFMRRNGFSISAQKGNSSDRDGGDEPAIWNLSDANLAAYIGIAPNTFRKIVADDPSVKWITVEKTAFFFLKQLEPGSPHRAAWMELVEEKWKALQVTNETDAPPQVNESPEAEIEGNRSSVIDRGRGRYRSLAVAAVLVVVGLAGVVFVGFGSGKIQDPVSEVPTTRDDGETAEALTYETLLFTPEQRSREIDLLLQSALEDFNEPSAASSRFLLSRMIQDLNDRQSDPTSDFEGYAAKLVEFDARLKEAEGYVSPEKLAQAHQALRLGDVSMAEDAWRAVLEYARSNLDQYRDKATYAAVQLGEIQIFDFRWIEGASHYKLAAELDPSIPNLSRAGNFLWRIGDYHGAEQYEQQVVHQVRNAGDPNSDELAGALSSLGVTLAALGKFQEAEDLYIEALEIRRANLAHDDPALMRTVNNYCNSLIAMDRLADAEKICHEALDVRRVQRDANPYSYAVSLIVTAGLERKQGNYETAAAFLREASEIAKNDSLYWGPKSARYAQAIYQLGLLLDEMGDPHEAESLIAESVQIVRDLNGELSPDLFIRMSALARVQASTDRQFEALSLASHAYTNLEFLLGDTSHPDVVDAKRNLEFIRDRLQLEP